MKKSRTLKKKKKNYHVTVALGLEKTCVLYYHVDIINIHRMEYTSNEAVGLKYIISNNINRDFNA